jgi:hypothetical protein
LNLETSESQLEVDKESTVKTSESTNWNGLTRVFIYSQLIKKLLVSTITLFSNPDLIYSYPRIGLRIFNYLLIQLKKGG